MTSGTTSAIGNRRRSVAPPIPSAVMLPIRPTVGRMTKTPIDSATKATAVWRATVEKAGTW